jgi:hypothetical protein
MKHPRIINIIVLIAALGLTCDRPMKSQAAPKNFGGAPLPPDVQFTGSDPGAVVLTDADLGAPGPGEVSRADVKYMQPASQQIGALLGQTPGGVTGTGSTWYPRLQTWKTAFDQFLTSRLRTNFLNLIPTMADYWSRDAEAEELAPQLGEISNWMQACGQYLIKAAGAHVSEQNGVIDAVTLAKFAKLFASRGFVVDADWEDSPMPINAAGVLILDAPAVVTELKAGPWQQAQRFLAGGKNATAFFKRYVATGDGLPVLKTKYAQNQTAIDAKFVELKNWVAEQEAAAGPP